MTFGNTANGRVAGHLADRRGVVGDQQCGGAEPGGWELTGALNDALEGRRGLGLCHVVADQGGEFGIEMLVEVGAQAVDIDVARAQHRNRVLILGQRQQEMFERSELVLARIRMRQRTV